MPFTPFHLGPGLLVKAAAPGRFSLLAYAASQVVIDVESGYHLWIGDWPIHRELHTFALGGLVGAASGLVAAVLSRPLVRRLPGSASEAARAEAGTAAGLLGGLTGGLFHALLDGLMHGDIRPFRPLTQANPLRGLVGLELLHLACGLAGVAGAVWLALRLRKARRGGGPSQCQPIAE